MVGGFLGKLESCFYVNMLVYSVVMKLKGELLLIDFLVILEESVICDGIVQFQYYQVIVDYWQWLDIVIFGIGLFNIFGNFIWCVFYGSDVIDYFND